MQNIFHLVVLTFCSVFIVSNGNAQSTIIHNFDDINGRFPCASLVSDGTFLYGMTQQGGVNEQGTIFKIMPDGNGFVKLLDFDVATSGYYINGSLILVGGVLYGMASEGGTGNYCTFGCGTIFKIMPDGSGFDTLLNFRGLLNGAQPCGDLFFDGTFLYGMTRDGGTNFLGTIFKIMPDGSGYVKLMDFDGALNGSLPFGSLISDGTFLYGITSEGGANNKGTVFKIMPDGSGYTKLLDFNGASNGSDPPGSLITDGTYVYGMTRSGGANDDGTIFKIKTDGSGYVKLLDFAGTANGAWPYGSLIFDGTFLYGTTYIGGANDLGTVFKIKPDGSGYIKMVDFAGPPLDGSYPFGSLYSDGTFIYGTTYYGGYGPGTVFKINLITNQIEESGESGINIYPSPTNGAINVVCNKAQKDARLELINMVGQTIISNNNINLQAGENYFIDISSLENGVYILLWNGYRKTIVKN